jgi:RNA polymerase sigma factor (sigma-70 family)
MRPTDLHRALHALSRSAGSAPGDATADGQLLERFTAGRDEVAFAELVRRHGPMVLGVGQRLLRHAHDAEEVFQAAFLVLARKAAALPRHATVGPWLYEVARRLALRARAARGRPVPRLVPPPPPPEPPAEAARRELVTVLDAELARLPARYRAALVLCYLEGLSYEEAARRLGCSTGALRRQLQSGRERLRRRLAQRGLAPTPNEESGTAPALVPAPGLCRAAVQGAVEFTSGGRPAGAVLAEGLLSATRLHRLKTGAAMVLVAVLTVGTGVGLAARALRPDPPSVEGSAETRSAREVPLEWLAEPLPAGTRARLGTLRWRESAPVGAVVYSSDGKYLASAAGSTVTVRQAPSGTVLCRLNGTNYNTNLLALAPDGRTLAAAGVLDDAEESTYGIGLWDVSTGRLLRSLTGHKRQVLRAAFTADGETLVSVDDHGGVHLWDVASGKENRQFQVSSGAAVTAAVVSLDGRWLAFGTADREVQLWDLDAARFLRRQPAPQLIGHALVFSPDGRNLFAPDQDFAPSLWEVGSGRQLWRLPCDRPLQAAAFSPDGKVLALSAVGPGGWDQGVRLCDAATGRELRRLTGAYEVVQSLAFTPDGKTLAAGADQAIYRWDVASGRLLGPADQARSAVWALAVSPDGRTIAATGDGVIRLWETETGSLQRTLRPPPERITALAFAPAGPLLASYSWDSTIRLWNMHTGEEVRGIRKQNRAAGSDPLCFSPDGGTMIAADIRALAQWDVATGKEVRRIDEALPGPITALALSPDGKTAASSGDHRDGVIRLWDIVAGRLLRILHLGDEGSGEFPVALAFSPDGQTLASAHWGDAVVLWIVATGQQRQLDRLGSGHHVGALAFSPDGRILAGGDDDGTVRVWDAQTLAELHTLSGHEGGVRCLAFLPDGRTLASGSADTTVLLWDVPVPAAPTDSSPPEKTSR